jgi:hypothetical protein
MIEYNSINNTKHKISDILYIDDIVEYKKTQSFNNNQNIQLDGATNFGNNWYDSNNQVFYLFRDPNSSNTVANENYSLDVAQMVINTTNVLPFVNALTPDVKNQTIILNKMNNYAMGSLVGVATNDIRILITSFNGAAFSN